VNGDARRVHGRFDELEVQRRGQILKQGESGAEGAGWTMSLYSSTKPGRDSA
jgi:hypothetical protein